MGGTAWIREVVIELEDRRKILEGVQGPAGVKVRVVDPEKDPAVRWKHAVRRKHVVQVRGPQEEAHEASELEGRDDAELHYIFVVVKMSRFAFIDGSRNCSWCFGKPPVIVACMGKTSDPGHGSIPIH